MQRQMTLQLVDSEGALIGEEIEAPFELDPDKRVYRSVRDCVFEGFDREAIVSYIRVNGSTSDVLTNSMRVSPGDKVVFVWPGIVVPLDFDDDMTLQTFSVTFVSDGYLDAEMLHECLSENLNIGDRDRLFVDEEKAPEEQ